MLLSFVAAIDGTLTGAGRRKPASSPVRVNCRVNGVENLVSSDQTRISGYSLSVYETEVNTYSTETRRA